jgi:predicted dithiol-disulfide oxidoreductase (DUF899 family)
VDGPGCQQLGIDLLTPVYNILDLTPEGRDDWYARLTYPTREIRRT